jgi:DNA modification methylase
MCVTSPPYFGLRDYGHPGQIGLGQTPAEYVAAMVEVFALVRELLADDGVLWLNLGDSYFSNIKGTGGKNSSTLNAARDENGTVCGKSTITYDPVHLSAGDLPIKPKDLIGIPWRVAFALQEAGWYLRQDIIWHKPNPMPESVRDRCTKAHEYVFLLSKSARYYFDAEAIKEPASPNTHARISSAEISRIAAARADGANTAVGCNRSSGKVHPVDGMVKSNTSFESAGCLPVDARNRRSVWTVATKPYKGAHFATFPPALIEPMILAGSRPGDVVFDPFMGSGTTAQVAQSLGRQWLGCELNEDYRALQTARLAGEKPR